MASTNIEIDQEIPSVTKAVTRQSIDLFESVGILDVQNIHNNEDIARQRLGTDYILASGRMSITFAAESLRKFFGPEVFNHTGTVNLKFLRPGDQRRHHYGLRQGRPPGKGRPGNPGFGGHLL